MAHHIDRKLDRSCLVLMSLKVVSVCKLEVHHFSSCLQLQKTNIQKPYGYVSMTRIVELLGCKLRPFVLDVWLWLTAMWLLSRRAVARPFFMFSSLSSAWIFNRIMRESCCNQSNSARWNPWNHQPVQLLVPPFRRKGNTVIATRIPTQATLKRVHPRMRYIDPKHVKYRHAEKWSYSMGND